MHSELQTLVAALNFSALWERVGGTLVAGLGAGLSYCSPTQSGTSWIHLLAELLA